MTTQNILALFEWAWLDCETPSLTRNPVSIRHLWRAIVAMRIPHDIRPEALEGLFSVVMKTCTRFRASARVIVPAASDARRSRTRAPGSAFMITCIGIFPTLKRVFALGFRLEGTTAGLFASMNWSINFRMDGVRLIGPVYGMSKNPSTASMSYVVNSRSAITRLMENPHDRSRISSWNTQASFIDPCLFKLTPANSTPRPEEIMSSQYFRALLVPAPSFTFVIPPLVGFRSAP